MEIKDIIREIIREKMENDGIWEKLAREAQKNAEGWIKISISRDKKGNDVSIASINVERHSNGAAVLLAAYALMNDMAQGTEQGFEEILKIFNWINRMERHEYRGIKEDSGEGVEHPAG